MSLFQQRDDEDERVNGQQQNEDDDGKGLNIEGEDENPTTNGMCEGEQMSKILNQQHTTNEGLNTSGGGDGDCDFCDVISMEFQ